MANTELGYIHRFEPASWEGLPTLLLLHGTGGDENDLMELGQMLLPGAARLSPRGNVMEGPNPRFFRRLREGVFDLEDVRRRAGELAAFVQAASTRYGFDAGRVIAVGYSNGANIAGAVTLLHPGVLAGGVLFHAMVPLVPDPLPALDGVPVFLGAGRRDPIATAEETERLHALLTRAGAQVERHWHSGGHELRPEEVEAAQTWLRNTLPTG